MDKKVIEQGHLFCFRPRERAADVLNRFPEKRFREIDDLLAFISICDDPNRARAYKRLLRAGRGRIAGSVCVEAGCGCGVFSVEMAKLGAGRVYAVEHNPLLADLARLANWCPAQRVPA